MVLKILIDENSKYTLKLNKSILINENINFIDHKKNNFYFFYDIILTGSLKQLSYLSKRFPASLILFYSNKKCAENYDNVYCLSKNYDFNDEIQINNILILVKKIKESYFRKTILSFQRDKYINNISKKMYKIGYLLKIYNEKNKPKFLKNSSNKSAGIILRKKNIFGFYIKKDSYIYFFKSKWHDNSNVDNKIIKELIYGLKKSYFFKNHNKVIPSIDIEIKEKFLGEHIGEGLFVVDLNNKITFYNKMFKKMFKINKKEIIGKKLCDIIKFKVNYDLLNHWNNFSTNPIKVDIESNLFGFKKYYNITYSPIYQNEKIVNICGIIRDITIQRKMENEIKISKINVDNINRKLLNVQNAIIMGFSKLSEYKDRETGGHLDRIQNYVKIISEELYHRALFIDYDTRTNYLSDEYIEELSLSSLLHDIGKVGIPDHILLKPGRLSKEEYKHMQLHTKIGGDTLKCLDDIVGELSFLAIAKEIAYFHHEKWNGMGYPFGLKHDQIPLSARIVSICDVYDALTTKRPYKNPYSHERTCEIIYDLSGTQFDPIIISVFSSLEREFKKIRKKYSD